MAGKPSVEISGCADDAVTEVLNKRFGVRAVALADAVAYDRLCGRAQRDERLLVAGDFDFLARGAALFLAEETTILVELDPVDPEAGHLRYR